VFGVDQRSVQARYIGSSLALGDYRIPYRMLVAFGVALVLTFSLTLYLSKTFTGRAIKAVAQDEPALRLMGANPVRIKQWAFGIATGVSALAGAMLIVVGPVEPAMDRVYIGRTFCVVVLIGLSPVNEYFFFAAYVVLTAVTLATAWNILGGYAGYVNFGPPAFFGIGAYTAVVLFKWLGAPLVVQIAAGALMGGLLGFGVGLLTLRLRGIFFAIATVAVVFIMETVMINWRYVGGATGLQLLRPPLTPPFDTYTRMLFVVMAVMAVGSVCIARYVQDSWIGRGLRAIRDSEEAAEASGVPTLKLKLFACVISGALMGAAGAPMPMYLSFIEPASTFNLSYTISAL